MSNDLTGIWKTDLTDTITREQYGNIEMDFRQNGELIYTIFEQDKKQIIILTYEVSGDILITDQPSTPRRETTKFALTGDHLELIYEGVTSKFLRVK